MRPALSYHFWHVYRRICCITADRIPHFAASYRFSAVWDGDKLQKNACVSIRGDKIESVGACPVGAIDLSRYTAIPGMIDVHTHLTYVHQNPVSEAGRSAAVVYLAAANAKKTLEAGVTAVRDLGAQNYSDIAMRDLINKGFMTGPRMFVAGYGLQGFSLLLQQTLPI